MCALCFLLYALCMCVWYSGHRGDVDVAAGHYRQAYHAAMAQGHRLDANSLRLQVHTPIYIYIYLYLYNLSCIYAYHAAMAQGHRLDANSLRLQVHIYIYKIYQYFSHPIHHSPSAAPSVMRPRLLLV
jgi:hypothetical protein